MSDTAEKLIRMADQILRNLPPGEARADQVADHIRRFWTPKMRADIAVAIQGKDLDPVLAAALKQV